MKSKLIHKGAAIRINDSSIPKGFHRREPVMSPCRNEMMDLDEPQAGQGRCVMFLIRQTVTSLPGILSSNF